MSPLNEYTIVVRCNQIAWAYLLKRINTWLQVTPSERCLVDITEHKPNE